MRSTPSRTYPRTRSTIRRRPNLVACSNTGLHDRQRTIQKTRALPSYRWVLSRLKLRHKYVFWGATSSSSISSRNNLNESVLMGRSLCYWFVFL